MDLVHNGGGGGFGLSPLFTFFFTFNWKRTIKQCTQRQYYSISWPNQEERFRAVIAGKRNQYLRKHLMHFTSLNKFKAQL